MAAISDPVRHASREQEAQRVLPIADLPAALRKNGHQAGAEEALAVEHRIILRAAQVLNECEEVARLVGPLVPDEQGEQADVLVETDELSVLLDRTVGAVLVAIAGAEDALVAFAHHHVDTRIGIEAVQFFDQRCRQHGITKEGGLYDQEFLHSSVNVINTLSMRWPSISSTSPLKRSSVMRSPGDGMWSNLLRK